MIRAEMNELILQKMQEQQMNTLTLKDTIGLHFYGWLHGLLNGQVTQGDAGAMQAEAEAEADSMETSEDGTLDEAVDTATEGRGEEPAGTEVANGGSA